MSKICQDRRRLVGALAVGGGLAAVGGAAVLVTNAQGRFGYDEAIGSTWRPSDSTDLPLPGVRRELVRYATLAANSHNTQPWRFRLSDRSILVLPDPGRRLHAVDPDDHHVFASLGCAVENIVQAAGAFGLRAFPSFEPNAGGIRVDLDRAPQERTDLFDAIPRRQSTRGVYDGRPVPPGHLRLLEAAGNGSGVRMLLFTERKQRDDILSYLIAANSAQIDDPAFVDELKAWFDSAMAKRSRRATGSSRNPRAVRFCRDGSAA
jgi:hypothetical protein